MLIDTHAHLDFPDFADDLEAILQRARDAGVERIITVGTTLESSARAVELATQYPIVYATVGIHPGSAHEVIDDFLPTLKALASHPKVVAIGEIGLDYFHLPGNAQPDLTQQVTEALQATTTNEIERLLEDGAIRSRQAEVFLQQLELAIELGLPVVIHQRDSWDDTLALLEPYTGKVRAVFHCFGGTPDQAAQLAAMGHLVSFTGIVTFKNAGIVRETAAAVAEDGYMVEADCPYLAPEPDRGKRCEPAHVRIVADAVAEARGVLPELVIAASGATAQRFFRFAHDA